MNSDYMEKLEYAEEEWKSIAQEILNIQKYELEYNIQFNDSDSYSLDKEQINLISKVFIPALENTKHSAFVIDTGVVYKAKDALKRLYLIISNETYTDAERELLKGLREMYINRKVLFAEKKEHETFDNLFDYD